MSKKEIPLQIPDNDFGFSFLDKPEENWEVKFNTLKTLIMPLLKNLAKNPEKDIHWPDRDKKINELIKKIQEI